MREESLLEDMRAAVRGDRQRAAQRRAESASPPTSEDPPPVAEETEIEPADQKEEAGWFGRITRRRRPT